MMTCTYWEVIFVEEDQYFSTPGCLSFINILLIMAGVEQNPGPNEDHNFRYQYILIELGAEVLRNAFNEKIGNDLNVYLNTFPKHIGRIRKLIQTNVITEEQKQLLPPICRTPLASTFDITLLTCLLRNICGLLPFGDPVWTKPQSTDLSLEAEITRLRLCRNEIVHRGSVVISDLDLQNMTGDLVRILLRLNGKLTNSVVDLQEKIDSALTMSLDKVDLQNYQKMLRDWEEMDRLFDHGLADLAAAQTGMKRAMSDDHDEIKAGLSHVKIRVDELKVSQDDMNSRLERLSVVAGMVSTLLDENCVLFLKEEAPLKKKSLKIIRARDWTAEPLLGDDVLNASAELLSQAFPNCPELNDLYSEESVSVEIALRRQDVIEVSSLR